VKSAHALLGVLAITASSACLADRYGVNESMGDGGGSMALIVLLLVGVGIWMKVSADRREATHLRRELAAERELNELRQRLKAETAAHQRLREIVQHHLDGVTTEAELFEQLDPLFPDGD
jgi:hypothetical protein